MSANVYVSNTCKASQQSVGSQLIGGGQHAGYYCI